MTNDNSQNTNSNYSILKIDDIKIKTLAQSLQNGTAQKIIELLQDNVLRSQQMIAKELHLPKATVYYATQLLLDSELIIISKKELSLKHKEVCYYSLNQKPIVICPQKKSLFSELKQPLFSTIGLITIFSTYILTNTSNQMNEIQSITPKVAMIENDFMMMEASSGMIVNETIQNKTINDVLFQFDVVSIIIVICIFISLVFLISKIINYYKK